MHLEEKKKKKKNSELKVTYSSIHNKRISLKKKSKLRFFH